MFFNFLKLKIVTLLIVVSSVIPGYSHAAQPQTFVCSGSKNVKQSTEIDCMRSTAVIDALGTQFRRLVDMRASHEREDLCALPYRRARELGESDPAKLKDEASQLLDKCNEAFKSEPQ